MKKCTIIVTDEVNVKLVGLELTERKKIVDKFKYEIPGARHLPAVRLGRWDGKVSFAQLGGSTYVNLLPEILPIIDAAGYDIELDDRRDYNTSFKFEEVKEDSFAHIMWPEGHVMAGQPIKLRDYQVHAINTYLQNPQSIQSLPTGAGKTIICAALSQRCEQFGRTLIIVPNKDLVRQTEEDYRNLGLDCGVFFGTRKEYNKQHTICTWQSLNSMFKKSKAGEAVVDIMDFIDGIVTVMVDECFDENSKVLTPDGYKPIRDINSGDYVINYSDETGEFKVDTVVKQHVNLTNSHSEKMYELEFDNGIKIKVTGNHKFLTNIGWIRADELTDKHKIINKEII